MVGPVEGPPVPLGPGETGLLAVHRSEPGLMLGYWNRPEEGAAVMRGYWFVGGDHTVWLRAMARPGISRREVIEIHGMLDVPGGPA